VGGFGAGGGSARAGQSDWNPPFPWTPSQNGLFAESPQRQSEIAVRPARSNSLPVMSTSLKSPSMRIGPFVFGDDRQRLELIAERLKHWHSIKSA